ncbi:hypothetical protein I306_01260 [Cryptococcus gattii EJB2]|uniref:Uncharacterized protein n=1 Tax=Cryptococcus gattii EJB2 TaxID=1296103 RepID=A0ABR5C180_9TREE|nr:hypothetical protein I306_01260 [Cryptococcus gattii EJB2]
MLRVQDISTFGKVSESFCTSFVIKTIMSSMYRVWQMTHRLHKPPPAYGMLPHLLFPTLFCEYFENPHVPRIVYLYVHLDITFTTFDSPSVVIEQPDCRSSLLQVSNGR